MAETPFLDQLQQELEAWQRQGVIAADQARRILAYYGLAAGDVEEARRQGRLAAILGILGALLSGIGVILLVASNWQQMGRFYRVLLLLGVLVAAYGVGYWLKYRRKDHPRIGAAFVFLGSLVFGANIFLVGQTYHVQANEPLLLVFWATGAFATAYAAVSRPSLNLAILVAVLWYALQLAAWHVERLGDASVIGLAAFVPYGLLLLSLGEVQRSFQKTVPFSGAFGTLGLVVAFSSLYLFTFTAFWKSLGYLARAPAAAQGVQPAFAQVAGSFAAFAVLALLATFGAMWRSGFSRLSMSQGIGVLTLGVSSLVVVFHPFAEAGTYAIIFNLVLLVGILWAVVLGLWTRRESFINIGLVFFVLVVYARYFDLFFTLMDRAMVFISAGLLLLAGGYVLERLRRRLVEGIRPGQEVGHGA